MKNYNTIQVPATTRKHLSHFTCDICKTNSRGSDGWAENGWDVKNVEISLDEGSNYPEYAFGETITYDICPKCFKEKLMPFLDSLGAKPEVKDYSN